MMFSENLSNSSGLEMGHRSYSFISIQYNCYNRRSSLPLSRCVALATRAYGSAPGSPAHSPSHKLSLIPYEHFLQAGHISLKGSRLSRLTWGPASRDL
ncbi:hypothetical protein J6590_070723 [Homalodisca vitripennis]|nr:hypothetical protein J6590_070723 [Homalodisca vitripennis]